MDINVTDKRGRNILHVAARTGQFVCYLLDLILDFILSIIFINSLLLYIYYTRTSVLFS